MARRDPARADAARRKRDAVPRQEELRLGPGAVELAPGEARPQGPWEALEP